MNSPLVLLLRSRFMAVKAVHETLFNAKTAMHANKLVEPEPFRIPFGIAKLALVTGGSMYIGGMVAKHAALFLEENEIFVPDEEDDD
uniref:Essential MCU regulator, mitochondrial n=1 Tax=Plectus sambesii TaxID=2011161 RepID=A0A914WHW5_9BILA